MVQRIKAYVQGRVQGVGFRPTVYRYASSLGLDGKVKNTSSGVVIEVQGDPEQIDRFFRRLLDAPPPQARIEHIRKEILPPGSFSDFTIAPSEGLRETLPGFPPDLGSCEECRDDISDPHNRRYRYAFANCTNCGPRFTIIRALPYDRERTSMSDFILCPMCAAEYSDAANRRFEAQPNACPQCGPRLTLCDASGKTLGGDPIRECARLLNHGAIIAIKGLGGYHLACSAICTEVIAELRRRKGRPAKALAVMFSDLAQAEQHCGLAPEARNLLEQSSRPIAVCQRLPSSSLSSLLSPDTHDLGIMLPYTPLHHLLLSEISPLVMTSGNRSEEPIVRNENELARLLGPIADYALVHDRPILRACDDSVLKVTSFGSVMLRRARGYVPDPCLLPLEGPEVLACGGDLKNTFCLTRGHHAWLSQHFGDLADFTSFRTYQEQITDWQALLGIRPQCVAHDLHPDYHSSRHARSLGPFHLPVQHHHAHIAACMAEHGLQGSVIGVAFDGSGYGPDQTIWGGEFLVASYRDFFRAGHLKPYPLPGGEEAIRHPARMGLSVLVSECGEDAASRTDGLFSTLSATDRGLLIQLLRSGYPWQRTSSAGRLFDAVAALLGFDEPVTYEGQAAVRLQTLAGLHTGPAYPFATEVVAGRIVLSFAPMFEGMLADLRTGSSRALLAARFHSTLATAVAQVCSRIAREHHLDRVVLGGGVFQNELLLSMVRHELTQCGLQVYYPVLFPANDGGLALGQAAIALATLSERSANERLGSTPCA